MSKKKKMNYHLILPANLFHLTATESIRMFHSQPHGSSVKCCLYHLYCTLIFTIGMAALAGKVQACEIDIYVNNTKNLQTLKLMHLPPYPDLPDLSSSSEAQEDWQPFKTLIFDIGNVSMIETAGKALFYSHCGYSKGSLLPQLKSQPLPSKMFFEQPGGANRRLILFYEGLYDYNPAFPRQLTVYMSCINVNIKRTVESFTYTETPVATVAYKILNTRSFEPHPILRSIYIYTNPRLGKPEVTLGKPEPSHSDISWTLTGAAVGAVATYPATSYLPFAPLATIPAFSLGGLIIGSALKHSASQEPDYINKRLIQKGMCKRPGFTRLQPNARALASESVVTDEPDRPLEASHTRLRQTVKPSS
ncbi:hypothetical protein M3P05_09435 [Sansalvadorimonas sp. 2012CJ34-2]|uniref:Uncharacterized protein n=1 Tax=Parendozoicomonas callyspongiae TaxID=2942213 RepID=A0ABT0PFK1_9GAMM|nr:hypothetical protein [Sansalvadorimonas sp. 2012CJ34-2]MCL6270154.1 hypothetical protein [Sansalvadorimonas sp. 2012CJ34-2]